MHTFLSVFNILVSSFCLPTYPAIYPLIPFLGINVLKNCPVSHLLYCKYALSISYFSHSLSGAHTLTNAILYNPNLHSTQHIVEFPHLYYYLAVHSLRLQSNHSILSSLFLLVQPSMVSLPNLAIPQVLHTLLYMHYIKFALAFVKILFFLPFSPLILWISL